MAQSPRIGLLAEVRTFRSPRSVQEIAAQRSRIDTVETAIAGKSESVIGRSPSPIGPRSHVRLQTDATDRCRPRARSRGGAVQEITRAEVGMAASPQPRSGPDRGQCAPARSGRNGPAIPIAASAQRRCNGRRNMQLVCRDRRLCHSADSNRPLTTGPSRS